jgi:hypothetical protein
MDQLNEQAQILSYGYKLAHESSAKWSLGLQTTRRILVAILMTLSGYTLVKTLPAFEYFAMIVSVCIAVLEALDPVRYTEDANKYREAAEYYEDRLVKLQKYKPLQGAALQEKLDKIYDDPYKPVVLPAAFCTQASEYIEARATKKPPSNAVVDAVNVMI